MITHIETRAMYEMKTVWVLLVIVGGLPLDYRYRKRC